MSGLKQMIDELSKQFDRDKPDNLKHILEELYDLYNEIDVTHIEKIVLLINQCIVLDVLNEENIDISEKSFSRFNILEQIKTFYEEFVSSAIIDELEDNSAIAFKEQISYLIALLLYKIHNYIEAYHYFRDSKMFSDILGNVEINGGLNRIKRIQRDIHFAYCCEYIGTPEMSCDKLVEALKLLLGAKGELASEYEYWNNIKKYCYKNIDKIETNLTSNENIETKAFNIIALLKDFFNDERSIFAKLLIMQKNGEDIKHEYNEAVHVLAHCLNELNMFFSNQNTLSYQNNQEAIESLKRKNLIKMIARICIDSLGSQYGTCQATIRAEQGNGIDAILKMHEIETRDLKQCDHAELDFYQYYFESMFDYTFCDKENNHGEKFLDFCKKNYVSNPDCYQDGLLHYYIVLLRNELKKLLEDIVYGSDRNKAFFHDCKKIHFSGCFEAYEELRTHEFSPFVNSQIVYEREKLILVYKILRNLQDNRLPLFYEAQDFDEKLSVTESVEELYNLCKKFNEYSNPKNVSLKKTASICNDCRFFKENQGNPSENLDDSETENGIPVWVDGLTFDFYGDIKKFKEFLSQYANYKIMHTDDYAKNRIDLENKILYFDNVDDCYNCCSKLHGDIKSGGKYHIFYVGDYDDDFVFNTIAVAAFKSIDICFLMAYIYESIGYILDYIFNPKPIYILAPLRNVSNYEFQEAEFDSLLRFPQNYTHTIELISGGIGIQYQKDIIEDDYFEVAFKNENFKKACICFVKLYEDKLYVLRDGKLMRKNVHIGLVNNMYDEYARARRLKEDKRHEKCKEEHMRGCACFYKKISNSNEFSRKGQNAATKLLHFLHIACEEQVPSIDNCYLLQSSFLTSDRIEGNGFQICIFNKNVANYFIDQSCFNDIVTVTKLYHDLERKKVSSDLEEEENINDEENKKKRLLERIEKLIGNCEEKRSHYQNHKYDKSLQNVTELMKEVEQLKREVVNGKQNDFEMFNSKFANLNEEFEKIIN